MRHGQEMLLLEPLIQKSLGIFGKTKDKDFFPLSVEKYPGRKFCKKAHTVVLSLQAKVLAQESRRIYIIQCIFCKSILLRIHCDHPQQNSFSVFLKLLVQM